MRQCNRLIRRFSRVSLPGLPALRHGDGNLLRPCAGLSFCVVARLHCSTISDDHVTAFFEQEAPLSEIETIQFSPRQRAGLPSSLTSIPFPTPSTISFNRQELQQVLDLYGRRVAAGEWRDYAVDFGREKAVFSVFRRASEVPLYRIEKCPKLARRQGAYSVVSATGLILKRGNDLARVLSVLEKSVRLAAV
jgi:hypothetical protein